MEPRRLAFLDQWFLNCSVATKFSYVPRTEQNLRSRGKLRQEESGKVFRGRGSQLDFGSWWRKVKLADGRESNRDSCLS